MTRDYVVSFVAEGLAVLLALLVYRVAAAQWSVDQFGEYALSRKIASAALVIALLGVDLAVVRLIAFDAAGDRTRMGGYVSGALVVVALASAGLAVVLLALPGPIGLALYGRPGHEDAVRALAPVALGGALYGVAYGTERGRLRMARAAALLVACTGAVPLLAVVASPASVPGALAVMGWVWAAVAVAAIVAQRPSLRARPAVGAVLAYGAPRAVGTLLTLGFLAAPAVVAAHRFGLAEAGSVAFALLVLGLLSTMLTPIGVVLMPRSARLLSERSGDALEHHVRRMLSLVVPVVTLAVLAIEVGADALVAAFLGTSYAAAAGALRAIAWAAIPWTFFVTLRALLDAHDVRPLNAKNVGLAFGAYGALVGGATVLGLAESAYHTAFVASVVVLAGLTLLDAGRALTRPASAEPVVEEPLQP